MPEEGVSKLERYRAKFGDRFLTMIPHMQKVGRALTPPIQFSYGGLVANTLTSHVLLEAALADGGPALQDRLVERLFAHYFENEGNLGDRAALVRIAADAGMDAAKATALLEARSAVGAAARAAVAKVELAARTRYRVTGVPFFVFNDAVAISGAQEPDALFDIFAELADE